MTKFAAAQKQAAATFNSAEDKTLKLMMEERRLYNEMSIKCALSYNATRDRIDGFEYMGSGGCSQGIGKQALVFMATGLFSTWKQPLGFFYIKIWPTVENRVRGMCVAVDGYRVVCEMCCLRPRV